MSETVIYAPQDAGYILELPPTRSHHFVLNEEGERRFIKVANGGFGKEVAESIGLIFPDEENAIIEIPDPINFWGSFIKNNSPEGVEFDILMFLQENFADYQQAHRLIAEAILYSYIWKRYEEDFENPKRPNKLQIPKLHKMYFQRKGNRLLPILEMDALPEGQDLQAKIDRKEDINLSSFVGLAQTIDYLHSIGVIIRDIKPENIVDVDGKYYLVDLGIGSLLNSTRDKLATQGDFIVGTVPYIAPETIESSKQATARSDLYSFALTILAIIAAKNGKRLEDYLILQVLPDADALYRLGEVFDLYDEREKYGSIIKPALGIRGIELLRLATNLDPNNRPNITLTQFLQKLIQAMQVQEA